MKYSIVSPIDPTYGILEYDTPFIPTEKDKFSVEKIHSNGIHHWHDMDGDYHRIDGPAIYNNNDHEEWRIHNLIHRVGGPAKIFRGRVEYYQLGMLHRLDGPAVIFNPIEQQWLWWYKGIIVDCHSQSEFDRILKLKFLW